MFWAFLAGSYAIRIWPINVIQKRPVARGGGASPNRSVCRRTDPAASSGRSGRARSRQSLQSYRSSTGADKFGAGGAGLTVNIASGCAERGVAEGMLHQVDGRPMIHRV